MADRATVRQEFEVLESVKVIAKDAFEFSVQTESLSLSFRQ
jgi:hypothetical protein